MEFEEFQRRGQQLLDTLRGLNAELDYNDSSIQWIDEYFDRNRDLFSEDGRYGIAIAIGFALGETMIREITGQWEFDPEREEWFVRLGDELGQANPISKAFKHLNEPFESIYSMLRVTRMVVEQGGWDALQQPPEDI